MIEARGLVKRYGATTAVDNLSFDVWPGQGGGRGRGDAGGGGDSGLRRLSPGLGFALLCLYAVDGLAAGGWALARRDT